MGIIFAAVLLFFVALSVLWSVFVRKLIKTRIKSICKIVCLVLAIIGTVAAKDFVLDQAFIKDTLLPSISSSLPAEVMDMINASPALLEVAAGLPVALVTPIVFVVLYIVFAILAAIVYMFILLFAGRKLKRSAKNNVPYAKARSIAWSACSAILALVVILLPIAFYGGLVDDAMSVLAETDVMDAETQKMVDDITKEYVDPITKGTVVEMFRAFGGDMIIDEMTSFPLNGETVYIKNEFGAIADLAGNVMPLINAEGGPESFGDKEADALVATVDSLTQSKFLVVIASEAVYLLTDDMVNGEEPMAMADNEMFGDLITRTITIVHDDAKKTDLFKADLKTVADMASALIKGGVLANMDDTDALMDELAGGDTIKNVIVVLGKNNSMKCLIPEVTNIGIEAIANAVEVKADATEAYNDLLNTIASDLNSAELDGENCVADFSEKLNSALDHAGITLDKDSKQEVLDSYSAALIKLAVDKNAEVTAEDVQNFFATDTFANPLPVQSVEAFEKATLLVFLDELVVDVDEAAKLINSDNANQEAEAIGGIFSQVGNLMDDVSGEKPDIGTMAESVGGILNSLNSSVSVGPERTSKLFIAIVQSDIVRDRDAANMDIATATELGTNGAGGDYAKTFKTISNTMNVLQNMNNSEGKNKEEFKEDVTEMLKDMTPESANMIGSYITEDRLANDYDLDEKQSEVAAPLISDVFGYMGNPENTENMTEEQYEAEAKAITDVMDLVTSASDRANNGNNSSLFGSEGDDSVLNQSADETIATIMSSAAIKDSLNNNSDNLEGVFFGTQSGQGGEGEEGGEGGEVQAPAQSMLSTNEKIQLEGALYNYYNDEERKNSQTEDQRKEDELALTNIGKLFGYSETQVKGILEGDFVTPQPQQ